MICVTNTPELPMQWAHQWHVSHVSSCHMSFIFVLSCVDLCFLQNIVSSAYVSRWLALWKPARYDSRKRLVRYIHIYLHVCGISHLLFREEIHREKKNFFFYLRQFVRCTCDSLSEHTWSKIQGCNYTFDWFDERAIYMTAFAPSWWECLNCVYASPSCHL